VWGRLADTNTVDWGRGGFGAQASPPPIVAAPPPVAPPSAWGAEPGGAAPSPAPAPPAGPSGAEWRTFLEAAGVDPAELKVRPLEAMATAGGMIRRLMGGLVVMMEARARAKAQMGAQGTAFSFEGNNPIKFARSPDMALTQMLNPPERGFMPADRAIEDAFQDLQAHQLATLAAMQGALAATLARFSPASIRQRAELRGVLARILPSARDATLWQAYEREFEGVARGSDEAFMDVFAKEFRDAYERVAADMKNKRQGN
jgi:type VI secretion system FHA domain protein